MDKITNYIINLTGFGKGHFRSNRAKKNIIGGLIVKGLNIGIGLLLVPLTINYLNPTNYGIWITLSSVVGWFGFFDIGFGNGMRNKFAEAIARNQHKLAKTYVSTTYAILMIIVAAFLSIFYIINHFVNWNSILNAGDSSSMKIELGYLAIVVFTSFGFSFVLNLITVILNADQRGALASLFDLIGKSISLALIYVLVQTTESSLFYLGVIYSLVTPLVLAVASLWFYSGRYHEYRPSFRAVDFSKARDLFSIGAKFFVIQIAGILLYQTNNMIISQLFGPEMVTPYSVSFKYFSIIMMGWIIIIGPFWSAITEAWTIKDIDWIKKIMRNLMIGWLGLFFMGGIMLFFAEKVFQLWIDQNFTVPIWISVLTLGWILVNAWNGIFSHFLNGVGKIKIQLIIGSCSAILNIPLAWTLGSMYGIEGVLLSNLILGTITIFIYPIQYYKIVSGKATGIFNK